MAAWAASTVRSMNSCRCLRRGPRRTSTTSNSADAAVGADRTKRVCRGVELDPLYVDVIIRRSNVWTYPGTSSLGSDARRGLQDHPTVKPTAMLEDALLDLTNRGEIVIDPFLGSGTTLMAAMMPRQAARRS